MATSRRPGHGPRAAPAIGAMAMGWLSTVYGLQAPVAGGAMLCLVVWALAMPRRRRLAAGLERAPATQPGA